MPNAIPMRNWMEIATKRLSEWYRVEYEKAAFPLFEKYLGKEAMAEVIRLRGVPESLHNIIDLNGFRFVHEIFETDGRLARYERMAVYQDDRLIDSVDLPTFGFPGICCSGL